MFLIYHKRIDIKLPFQYILQNKFSPVFILSNFA